MLFISHDQDDQAPLSQLRLIVKLAGIECWNQDAMQTGLSLREQLRQVIRECDVCLFLATRRSIGSSWCRAELGAFWGAGKRVVSLLQDADLTDADLPPQLQGDLWTRNAERAFDAIREEIIAARARGPLRDAEVKRSVCLVQSNDSALATGYLAAPDLVVCPNYCVTDREARFNVTFSGGGTVSALVALVDESSGTALLKLETPMPSLVPLRLVENPQAGSSCRGFGFPDVASGSALPFQCEIVDADHVDKDGSRWVMVHSPIFATGPLEGLGGSPVWTSAGVNGHVYEQLRQERSGSAAFGMVFLTPAPLIVQTLGRLVSVSGLTRR